MEDFAIFFASAFLILGIVGIVHLFRIGKPQD
jgi:hypothetical protein